MPTIEITRDWCGYSRGYTVKSVNVTEEELEQIKRNPSLASEFFWDGETIDRVVVRDDTESTGYDVDFGE